MRTPILLALTLCFALLPPATASLSRTELDERLLAAAGKADVVQCRELLRDGASASARDAAGRTPLIIACDNFPSGDDPEPPRAAERLEVCRLLVRAKADLNARSLDGSTALMTASGSSGAGKELVRLLLQSGARPNPADRLGQTALMFASGAYGDAETQSLLLARGADWRAVDWEGHTALWRAGSARRADLIVALVKAGAAE